MPRALVLGGTGLIGRAAAHRLLAAGWQVDVTGRDPGRMPPALAAAGARFTAAGRSDPAALSAVLGDGADLLVDCLAFSAADARLLLPLAARAASTVLVSSRAVYADEAGNDANSDVPPRFDGPVPETQRTVAPREDLPYASREGYGAGKAAAERVALDSGLPVTVLRPARVYGVGAAQPREWPFVKRALDRRPVLLLAGGDASRVHPTGAGNIAALIETVARTPAARVLNIADPEPLSVLDIARVVAGRLGHVWEETPAPAGLGATPWDEPQPMRLDLSAAGALGYAPAGTTAQLLGEAVDRLAEAARTGGVLPAPGAAYAARYLDYAAEDAFLAAARG